MVVTEGILLKRTQDKTEEVLQKIAAKGKNVSFKPPSFHPLSAKCAKV